MALPNGLRAREYGSYRQIGHGETAVAIVSDDEARNETLEVLAAGDTEILPAPGATKNLVIKGFHFSNDAAAKVTVSLKAGVGGDKRFSTVLAANGGNFDKNLVGRNWELPINKALVVNLSGASDVHVSVEYLGGVEPAEEAVTPTDAITFTESLKVTTGKKVVEAITFAEAFTKKAVTAGKTETLAVSEAVGNKATLNLSDAESIAESEIEGTGAAGLTDAMSIAEALVLKPTKNVVDTQSIAEAVGNKLTLSVNDAQAIVDANVVIVHGT